MSIHKGIVLLVAAAGLSIGLAARAQVSSPVSFSQTIQPYFDRQCVVCHTGDDHMGELVLERGLAYSQIVGVPAVQLPTYLRVEPGDPQGSYLFRKVLGDHRQIGGVGWSMPPPSHPFLFVSEIDREALRQWILEGARDN